MTRPTAAEVREMAQHCRMMSIACREYRISRAAASTLGRAADMLEALATPHKDTTDD